MPTGERLESIVRRFDRTLTTLERDAIRRLDTALRSSAIALEEQLRALYNLAVNEARDGSAAFREARARTLLAQVRGALIITDGTPADDAFGVLIRRSYELGAANASVMLGEYGVTAALTTLAPLDAAARATNASARLAQHGAEFAQRAERIIIDGIIRGRGFTPTARELRRETGITRSAAERIVRTETIAASDEARRDTYRENGVEQVQHMTTMDDRLCGYCASRAGRVYDIGDAEVPLHPNCRCYLAPWKSEWQDAGLTDDAWFKEHRSKSRDRTLDPIRTGPAPSERWRGRTTAPTPVWSP